MAPSAHLTLLWGTTPVAVAHVPNGRAMEVSVSGLIARKLPFGEAALVVRVASQGATVTRLGRGAREARHVLHIATGGEMEVPVVEPTGAFTYRDRVDGGREPLVLRVAVTLDEPRPRGRIELSGRSISGFAGAAALHGIGLLSALGAMPVLGTLPHDAMVGEEDYWALMPAPVMESRAPSEAPGGDAPDVCSEIAAALPPSSLVIAGPDDNEHPHLGLWRALDEPCLCCRSRIPPHWEDDPAWTMGLVGITSPPGYGAARGKRADSPTALARGPLARDVATCFGDPPPSWTCGQTEVPPAATSFAFQYGHWKPDPAPVYPWRAHVELGPIGVAANVPRWRVVAGVRSAVERSRACFERALEDEPGLSGNVGVVLRVRGGVASAELGRGGELAVGAALRCCLEHAHEVAAHTLPTGTRANAVYTIKVSRPEEASSDAAGQL